MTGVSKPHPSHFPAALPRPRWGRNLILAGIAMWTWACQVNSTSLDKAGALVRERPPAPYKLLVLVPEVPAQWSGAEGDLAFAYQEPATLQGALVKELRNLNAFSEVVGFEGRPGGAWPADVDLAIQPRFRSSDIHYEKLSSGAPLSCLLWMITWIGSLWVPDCRYSAHVEMGCEFIDPTDRNALGAEKHFESSETELRFLDRNDFLSLGTLESLVIPPFWTHDDRDKTGESVTKRAVAQLAAQIKNHVLDQMPQELPDSKAVHAVFKSPTPAATSARSVPFECEVCSVDEVAHAFAYLNGVEVPGLKLTRLDGAPAEPLPRFALAPRIVLTLDALPLELGNNTIRLRLELKDREVVWRSIHATRTSEP